jgi:hypothetical protein
VVGLDILSNVTGVFGDEFAGCRLELTRDGMQKEIIAQKS